jgi:hypothetical protein
MPPLIHHLRGSYLLKKLNGKRLLVVLRQQRAKNETRIQDDHVPGGGLHPLDKRPGSLLGQELAEGVALIIF